MENNDEKRSLSLGSRIAAVSATVAFIAFVSAGAASATGPVMPDPATVAGDLVDSAGSQYVDGLVSILPLLIPFLLAIWAIGFVYTKVRPKRKGGF